MNANDRANYEANGMTVPVRTIEAGQTFVPGTRYPCGHISGWMFSHCRLCATEDEMRYIART